MDQNPRNTAFSYGAIYGLISVTLVVIQYVMGDFKVGGERDAFGFWGILGLAAAVVLPLLAMLQVRKDQGGLLSYGQGFKTGFTVFIIGSLFSAMWMLLYTYLLEPGYQETMLNQSYAHMKEQGLDEDTIEQSLDLTRKFTSPLIMSLWTILGAALLGAIVSLILALFTRRESDPSTQLQ